ncbi:MAG: CHASE2 domain-containing protein [Symploca sp. SIO1A3]|nr:CHASE2 domain-containing protein [Symploca sp. SIO1A3]
MKPTSGELTENSVQSEETVIYTNHEESQATTPAKLSIFWSRLKRVGDSIVTNPALVASLTVLKNPALVASLTVTSLLLIGRQLGFPEPLELSAYDKLLQLRPGLPPDERLLIVEITEEDVQSLEEWPMTDKLMNQLLEQLEQYQPAVIGLDIFRDISVPPGHKELSSQLKNSDRIIPICKISNAKEPGTPPPPSVPEERVGFADLAIDPNGVVRRGLLFVNPTTGSCTTTYSFSFQLARYYLEQKGIQPEIVEQDEEEYLKLGQVIFKPLLRNSGAYQKADTGGYQILLNYRSANSPGRNVTLTEVLNNQIDPSWVKDRIVLIGVSAPSLKDNFYTPYSFAQEKIERMPGVMIHGQVVSQILSIVLDEQPLFWFLPEWGEALWIWGWSFAGGFLVLVFRHPGKLVLAEGIAISLLLGTSVGLFFSSGWVPVVAPCVGLITAGTGVLAYSAYKTLQERSHFASLVQEQEDNIAQLSALLKERSTLVATEPSTMLVTQTEVPPDEESTEVWGDNNTGDDGTIIWPPGAKPKTPDDPPPTEAGLLSKRYEIQSSLGCGGFGLTYLATDTQRPGKPQCVVKKLQPAHQDKKFLEVAERLFKTEAEILERLGTHPQIPQLLAYFAEHKEFYLIQEYIQGHPLSEEMPKEKRFPEAQVIEILKGVLEILSFIHKHQVIHRDIKPGNIMRRDLDGKLVLIDFGAVKQIQSQEQLKEQGSTVAIGTSGYAPPEQYAGHPRFSSDVYALGMIGIQALTGIHPSQLSVSDETGDVIWRNLANVSEELAQILEKMVRSHFVERYKSAALVIEDLKKLTG